VVISRLAFVHDATARRRSTDCAFSIATAAAAARAWAAISSESLKVREG
jgi:hypothetical protein